MGTRETRLAKLSAIAVLLLFSAIPYLVKSTSVDPFAQTAVRSFVAAIMVGVLIRRLPKPTWERYSVICAISAGVSSMFFIAACHYTDSSSAVAITYSWPLLVPLVGWLWMGKKTSRRELLLLGIGAVGIVLIFAEQWAKPLSFDRGKLMALVSGIAWAVYICSNWKVRGEGDLAFHVNVVTGIFGAAVFSFLGGDHADSRWDWTAMVLNGIASGLAIICFNYALKYWNTTAVTLVVSAEVAVGPLWVILFLGERPPPFVWAGMALITLTMFAAFTGSAKKEKTP